MTTNARPANRLIGSEQEHYEDMEAVRTGAATELMRCPVDDSLQGVVSTHFVAGRGTFDGTDVVTLRCNHVVI